MKRASEQTVDDLNKLIQVCVDGELGYRTAAKSVSSSKLRTIFVDYAIRRSQFAHELRAEVERQGGSAEDSGSFAASLHRGWITLASSVAHGDIGAIVAACETGEDAARGSYEAVLSSVSSGDTRTLIETQWKAIERAQQEMQHLKNQMAAGQHPEKD
jgi:uncharacterized protein (TIGR02284 family)